MCFRSVFHRAITDRGPRITSSNDSIETNANTIPRDSGFRSDVEFSGSTKRICVRAHDMG